MRSMGTKQEYLDALPAWDGVERIDTMLVDYLGSNNSRYVREVSRNMMLSAVACALDGTMVSPVIPLLVSHKPCGKSVFLRKLGSGYSEVMIGNITEKRLNRLAENLLVEMMAEGDALGSGCRNCRFLPVMTYNMMPDVGGSRRIMPVRVGRTDTGLAYVAEQKEIDQLWAEALAAFKNGEMPYAGAYDAEGRKEEEKPIIKRHPFGID